ncbi:GDSL esterase/lipase At5g45960-like [Rutidosis leptorrhynchoides]|uniref:GDSL esterase/lipase At5g45960-like n=1 Tax=Rutidosis leptorrhynchoides TaxID=125765 RepID=UPI003A998E4C
MHSSLSLYTFISLFFIIFTSSYADQSQMPVFKQKPSALFVFGDSTVDPGNNNYIKTYMKSNFPPYGRDFIDHIPTGRFSNGRLVTDFIASYIGVKDTVPAYLDPTLRIEDLMTGVSFASAGSGFDPMTATLSMAISLEQQMEYFKEYKSKMEVFIGKDRTLDLIKKSVTIISAATNDYIVNYYGLGELVTPVMYPNVASYNDYLIQNVERFIKELMNQGFPKIAMVGLPPMGCVPGVITLKREAGRKCVEMMLPIAMEYNLLLQNKLKAIQTPGTRLYYADIYKPILDMVQIGQTNLGFEEVNVGCCGSGYVEAAILCNRESTVCDDASKYVFFDSVHPTEKAYDYIFTSIRPVVDMVLNDTLI